MDASKDTLARIPQVLHHLTDAAALEKMGVAAADGFVIAMKAAAKAWETDDLNSARRALSSAVIHLRKAAALGGDLKTIHDAASLLFEDVKRHIDPPAELMLDLHDLGSTFIPALQRKYGMGFIPKFLENRAFPADISPAIEGMRQRFDLIEIPDEVRSQVETALSDLERVHAAVEKGQPSGPQLAEATVAIGTLFSTISMLEGTVLTRARVFELQAWILFAWPGWLCWNWVSWLIQALIVIAYLANGERISFTVLSSTGPNPTFNTGGTAGNGVLDIAVTGTTSEPTHAPVTVTITGLALHDNPGAWGNVVTNLLPSYTVAGGATATATGTVNLAGAGNQGPVPGVSKLEVTLTGTCANGDTGSRTVWVDYVW